MGSYRFKWPHTADEVIVTGTFDNWAKTIKLDKKAWAHEKTVDIPDTKDEILYKFVVNGQWRVDPSHAVKRDHEGNENNVLDPDDITPSQHSGSFTAGAAAVGGAAVGATALGAAAISSIGPGATTTSLAGEQPIEEKTADLPGAFPVTPMESGTTPTLQDRVVGVNPIPATGGIGNPVQLQPGEKVPDPSTLTDNTIQNTVTTDKASYEAAGGAGGAAYSSVGKADDSAAHFGRPVAGGTIIPESGLPMGEKPSITQRDYTDPNLNSTGTGASTAALAGQQPIQPRGTPEVIKKDDDEGIAGKAAAGVAVAGVAAAGAAVAANELIKDKTGKDPASTLPQSTQDAINEKAKESNLPAQATGADRDTASNVPQEVTDSQKEANRAPEAAANEEAVKEKSAAEKELLAKVPESNAQGEPAPSTTAATTSTVPATTSNTGAPQLGDPVGGGLAPISMDDANKPTDHANSAAVKATQNQSQPQVTSGVAAGSTAKTSTPEKRNSFADRLRGKSEDPESPGSTATGKKEKRLSFMKRMKEKIKSL